MNIRLSTHYWPAGTLFRLLIILEIALLVIAITASAGEISSFLRALAGMVVLLALPFAAGSGPVAGFFRAKHIQPSVAEFLVFCLPTGILLMLAVAATLGALNAFNVSFILAGAGLSVLLACVVADIRLPVLYPTAEREKIGAVALALSISLAAALFYRWWSPFPFHPSWDIFAHATVIGPILAGQYAIDPRALSDSFTSFAYPTSFHLFQAASLYLVSGTVDDFIGMSWLSPFFLMPILALAMTGFGIRLGMPPLVAGIAAGAATFFFPWHRVVSPTELLPAVVAGVVVMWALATTHTRSSVALLIVAFIFHPLIGIMGGMMALVLKLPDWSDRLGRYWGRGALLALAVPLVLFALNPQWLPTTSIDLNPLTPAGWPDANTTPISKYREIVDRSVTYRIFLISIVSSFIAIILARRPMATPYAVLVLTLAIYFLPFAGVERFSMFLPFLVVATVLFASYQVIHYIAERLAIESVIRYIPPLALACLMVFFQARNGYLGEFLHRQRFTGNNAGAATSFSPAELEAAHTLVGMAEGSTWLIRPDGPGFAELLGQLDSPIQSEGTTRFDLEPQISTAHAVLVSDPDTQNVLGGLADLKTLGGGPYATDDIQTRVRSILNSPDQQSLAIDLREMVSNTYREDPEQIVLAYSGRTERWLDGEPRVYQPWDITNQRRADALKMAPGMEVLLDNESLLVLVARW